MQNQINNYLSLIKERKSDNTYLSYKRDLLAFEKFLASEGIVKVEALTRTSVMSYVFSLHKSELSPATISRNIASLRSFFKYLRAEGIVTEDLAEGMTPPKVEKRKPQTISIENVEKLLNQPNGKDAKSLRDKAMLEVMYATGIRVSEIVSLKVGDVDLRHHAIKLTGIKNRSRVIPIGNVAVSALKAYLKHSRDKLSRGESEYLFLNYNGDSMSRQGFWKIVKGYAKKAGISDSITPHTLRHSFAAHLIENGADLQVVQELMGHTSVYSVLPYKNLNSEKLDVNLGSLGEYAKAHPRY